jgi:hypothetical protein
MLVLFGMVTDLLTLLVQTMEIIIQKNGILQLTQLQLEHGLVVEL